MTSLSYCGASTCAVRIPLLGPQKYQWPMRTIGWCMPSTATNMKFLSELCALGNIFCAAGNICDGCLFVVVSAFRFCLPDSVCAVGFTVIHLGLKYLAVNLLKKLCETEFVEFLEYIFAKISTCSTRNTHYFHRFGIIYWEGRRQLFMHTIATDLPASRANHKFRVPIMSESMIKVMPPGRMKDGGWGSTCCFWHPPSDQ